MAWLTASRAFGLLLALGYLLAAWGYRVDSGNGAQDASLVYPLDTFSMYSELPEPTQTALALRGPDGTVTTPRGALVCDRPVQPPWPCARAWQGPRHRVRELLASARVLPAGAPPPPAELVAVTWRIAPWQPPVATETCVIARCGWP